MAGIFGKTLSELTSAMNYHLFRQGIISGNIANADTPGYTAKEVVFEKELSRELAMSATDSKHINPSAGNISGYTVKDDPFSRIGNDSNTVDIDREMMKLSQNHLLYSASAQMIQGKLDALKEAIRGIQ
ncbi:MAG TPA: flagellar basal body rod protein FlgB [Deltaproteobacteria bacterium]|nr:flagellar basal body rod protein FlgB [Deltaproteobacteria bacterium]